MIVALIGLLAFFNPAFARFINLPAGASGTQAVIAMIIGVIIAILGLAV